MKILFVINPISGGLDKSQIESDVKSLCGLHNIEFKIVYSDRSRPFLEGELTQFAAQRLVIIGGDGTVNQCVSQLKDLSIPIGLVPMGSANGISKELGLSRNLIDSLLDAVFSSTFASCDVISINGHLCLHLSDIGTNSQLISKFEQEPSRGMLSYAKHLLTTLLESEEKTFNIFCNQEHYSWQGHMLTFANASKYGSGMIINPGGEINDDYFELCNIKNLSIDSLLSIVFSKYYISFGTSKSIDQLRTKKALVTADKKYLLQVDGELIGEFMEFDIEMTDIKVLFAIPKSDY